MRSIGLVDIYVDNSKKYLNKKRNHTKIHFPQTTEVSHKATKKLNQKNENLYTKMK